MTQKSIDRRPAAQRALIVHPTRAGRESLRAPQARLEEAVGLARALDLEIEAAEIVSLRARTPATLFGKGKVEEIAATRRAADADVVVVDDALTPVQQRNLEKAWDAKVIDRTGLILEIFGRRARTHEGRLQVELARLAYERSRLVRTWTHLERQRGGFGVMGGPGETQIETDRRLIAERISRLKKELEEVRRTRDLQRAARKRAPAPVIALVGYTNAGKSTLFNRLTESKVDARDLLFATLDPTLRSLNLPDGRPAILSDTVGFVSDLPHELVDAFRATLEEVREANVIVHVRDIASPDSEAQAADVAQVLSEIGVDPEDPDRPFIEVWNKIDALDDEARERLGDAGGPRTVVPLSAATGQGCDLLLSALAAAVDEGEPIDLHLPAGDGGALAFLYRHGRVLAREDEADGGLKVTVSLDPRALGRFERLHPGVRVG